MGRPQTADPRHVLALLVEGLTVAEVAKELRCSRPTIYKAIARARAERVAFDAETDDVPALWPTFPTGEFTPATRCECDKRPIKPGSRWCCVVCHESGLDHLRYFKNARPIPPDAKPTTPTPRTPTRRERRQRRYAGREAAIIRRIIAKSGNRP